MSAGHTCRFIETDFLLLHRTYQTNRVVEWAPSVWIYIPISLSLQYDPRSRPSFGEICPKLDMLLEKLNSENALKLSSEGGEPKNIAKLSKRYSIDHYCSSWLTSSAKTSRDFIDTHEQNDGAELRRNGHTIKHRHHRRSLSENIIPFPAHTTPSDKARCHLINRPRGNKIANISFSSSDSNSSCSSSVYSDNSTTDDINHNNGLGSGDGRPISLFSNTTLRKVAETMFLKDPQYKPHLNSQTYGGKLNPFETLTQLKGVKKILGANPTTYTTGLCDLFSSCFEISLPFSKDFPSIPQQNDDGKSASLPQAKSLPSSPKVSHRKLSKSAMKSMANAIDSTSIDAPKPALIANELDTIMSASSQTGTLKKKNASSLFSHPLFKCKDDENAAAPSTTLITADDVPHNTNGIVHYFDNPKVLTRGGSSESGFFSCITDEDFSTHNKPLPKYSISSCPQNDYDSTLQQQTPHLADDRASNILTSLRSFDDFELFERNQKFECTGIANDSLSIDMGFVNRLSLDSEINSLFHKNQLSNQFLYCKNRTSSIYTDSSEDISSLAGSDSFLWDDRMSSYTMTIPNTRSAQIAKIVEYFERKGQNFKSTNGAVAPSYNSNSSSNSTATTTNTHNAANANSVSALREPHLCSSISTSDYYSTSSTEFLPYEKSIPTSYQTTPSTCKEYEAFCLDLDKGITPQRLNVCEGVVKSKLQLFDKLHNTKKEL